MKVKHLAAIAVDMLSHLDTYLDPIPDEAYAKPLPLLSDASIGAHTRHILDGYLCLMRQQAEGVISYDRRRRDPRNERDTAFAGRTLARIRKYLSGLETNTALELEVCYAEEPCRSASSLERELIHNIEHTIHHLAIIKIALVAYHEDIRLPEAFGVAPSTLRFRKENAVKPA